MLKKLDETLPLAESSGLANADLAGRFYLASRGVPDYLSSVSCAFIDRTRSGPTTGDGWHHIRSVAKMAWRSSRSSTLWGLDASPKISRPSRSLNRSNVRSGLRVNSP